MGILDSLFGSSGGYSSKKHNMLTQDQMQVLEDMLWQTQGNMNSSGKKVPGMTGNMAAANAGISDLIARLTGYRAVPGGGGGSPGNPPVTPVANDIGKKGTKVTTTSGGKTDPFSRALWSRGGGSPELGYGGPGGTGENSIRYETKTIGGKTVRIPVTGGGQGGDQKGPGAAPVFGNNGAFTLTGSGQPDLQEDPSLRLAQGTLNRLMTQGPQDIDAYFKATVQDPAMKQFTEKLLPQIRASYGNNFYGGERMMKEGRAMGDLGTTLAQERTRVAFEERNRDNQTALAAAGLSPELSTALARSPFERSMANMDALGRVMQLAGVEREVGMDQIRYEQSQQNVLLGLLGVQPWGYEGVATQPSSGLAQGVAGGLATGAGAYLASLAMACDPRLKKDVEYFGPVGPYDFYSFRYLWEDDDQIHIGPMADEVYEKTPDAVFLTDDGFLMLNLSKMEF